VPRVNLELVPRYKAARSGGYADEFRFASRKLSNIHKVEYRNALSCNGSRGMSKSVEYQGFVIGVVGGLGAWRMEGQFH
jgi:hypothetical protein